MPNYDWTNPHNSICIDWVENNGVFHGEGVKSQIILSQKPSWKKWLELYNKRTGDSPPWLQPEWLGIYQRFVCSFWGKKNFWRNNKLPKSILPRTGWSQKSLSLILSRLMLYYFSPLKWHNIRLGSMEAWMQSHCMPDENQVKYGRLAKAWHRATLADWPRSVFLWLSLSPSVCTIFLIQLVTSSSLLMKQNEN